jgi:hypothetical protein
MTLYLLGDFCRLHFSKKKIELNLNEDREMEIQVTIILLHFYEIFSMELFVGAFRVICSILSRGNFIESYADFMD